MKRSRGFVVPEEIDILSYVLKLKQYWSSFLLAFVVGVCGGYYYLLKTLPLPSTQAVLEIGFPDIRGGKYPDGNRFDKNDLVSIDLVRKAVNAIPELGQNGRWSPESLARSLSLSPIYPLDVQLALEALARPKLASQEVVSNFDKINNHFPSKFSISFNPSPLMPIPLQKKFLEELVKQYSGFVLDSRLPLSRSLSQKGAVLTEADNVAAYDYLAAAVDEFDEQIAINAKNASLAKQQSRLSGNDEEFARLSQVGNSVTLQKLKREMASIERLILGEKTVPRLDEYRNKLASDISLLSSEVEIKKKQAEYKIKLARIPSENAPKVNTMSADNGSQNADKTIMGILLSYNTQYYALINETNVIYDDISRMEGRLTRLKERLHLLNTGGSAPGGAYEARNQALGEHVKLAQGLFTAVGNELAENIKAAYAGYRPPVANSAVSGISAGISPRKAVFAGCAAVFLTMVFCLLKIIVNDAEAQRQAAMPAPQEIGSAPRVNIKK